MRSKRRRSGLFVSLLLVMAVIVTAGGASQAGLTPLLAGPGSAATTWYTPRVVILQGQPLVFRNLDVAPHDVWSGKPGAHDGKFFSAVIGFGKKTQVIGVKNLAKGNYNFYCALHPRMKGQLIVR